MHLLRRALLTPSLVNISWQRIPLVTWFPLKSPGSFLTDVVVRLCFHAIIFCFDLKIELLRFKYSMQGKYLLVNGLHHASEGSESQQKGIILESFLKTILICVSLFHIATEKCQ